MQLSAQPPTQWVFTLLLLDIAIEFRDHAMDLIPPQKAGFKLCDNEEEDILALALSLKLVCDKAHEAGDQLGRALKLIGVIGGGRGQRGDELVLELRGIEERVRRDEERVFIVRGVRQDKRPGRCSRARSRGSCQGTRMHLHKSQLKGPPT
jgi:hypothetical protein